MDKLSELRFIKNSYSPRQSKGFLSSSLAYTIAIFLVLFILAKTFLAYSDVAQPGNFLYPLKLTQEDVKIRLSPHPRDSAVLYGIFLETRLDELTKLSINPSPVFLKKTNIAIDAASNTTNETIAGIFTGDLYFEPTVASNQLETLSQLSEVLGAISENVDSRDTLTNIDELDTKLEHLNSKFIELANSEQRRVQAVTK